MQEKGIHVELKEPDFTVEPTQNNNSSQFQKLYEKIENFLKVFKMKSFKLTEGNDPKYNNAALRRYEAILETYKTLADDLKDVKDLQPHQRDVLRFKYYDVIRRCHNNIGCLGYSLGNYDEALKNFSKSCEVLTDGEHEICDLLNPKPQQKTFIILQRGFRLYNHAKCLAVKAKFLEENSESKPKMIDTLYSDSAYKLKLCLKTVDQTIIGQELEVSAVILNIEVNLKLKNYLEILDSLASLRSLKNQIWTSESNTNKRRYSQIDTLSEIVQQHYCYLKAKFKFELLCSLLNYEARPPPIHGKSFYSSSVFSPSKRGFGSSIRGKLKHVLIFFLGYSDNESSKSDIEQTYSVNELVFDI